MSTRCLIGVELKGRKYKYIYCQSDGYPEYVGKILIENYTTRKKVNELIKRGNLSSLGETIDECKFYNDGELYQIDYLPFIQEHHQEYIYMFNLENEWVCKAVDKPFPFYDFDILREIDLYHEI